jgi:5-methylcytosine-specific restriction endonuclease McrA
MLSLVLRFLPYSWRPRVILAIESRSKWRTLRKAHLVKQPACAACGRVAAVEVHHIVPVSVDPTKELDENNLITLCASPCHIVFGHLMNYHCHNKDVVEMTAHYRQKLNQRPCVRSK